MFLPLACAAGCSLGKDGLGPETSEQAITVPPDGGRADYTLSRADLDSGAEGAERIVFGERGSVCLIDRPGKYLLAGKWEGQIRVDVQDEIVHLVLEDLELQSYSGPAIYVVSAAKVVVTVPEGSSAVIRDTGYYEDAPDAKSCIYSSDDLTFNGGGSLQVYGYGKDAVRTEDTLKILDISIAVQAKDTGLRGNDGVAIKDAAVDVQCEGTGIYTKKAGSKTKGFVDVEGGTLKIIAGEYAMDVAQDLYVRDCAVDIYGVVQDIVCQGQKFVQDSLP